jgi:hypothetical protein
MNSMDHLKIKKEIARRKDPGYFYSKYINVQSLPLLS